MNQFCLALTGGIACGKSTVGGLLAKAGLARIDSDRVARDVVKPGSPGLTRVVEAFGYDVLQPDGALDRKAVAGIVFASVDARRALEAILHPLIWDVMAAEIERAERQAQETVFEIPLLFENGNQDRFSTVWVVTAPSGLQLQRLLERDGLGAQEAQARLDSQMSVAEKARRASFVLTNDGEPNALEARVAEGLRIWRKGRVPSS